VYGHGRWSKEPRLPCVTTFHPPEARLPCSWNDYPIPRRFEHTSEIYQLNWSRLSESNRRPTHYERVLVRCSGGSNPPLASCSQVVAGGHRWLLMVVRGHLGGTRARCVGQLLVQAVPSYDRLLSGPGNSPTSATKAKSGVMQRCGGGGRVLPLLLQEPPIFGCAASTASRSSPRSGTSWATPGSPGAARVCPAGRSK
jgi:hypothetical protein